VILSADRAPWPIALQTDQLAPSGPGKPKVSSIGTYTATVSWERGKDNLAVSHYDLELNGKLVATVAGTSHTFKTLLPGKTFSIRVRTVDFMNRVSPFSKNVTFATRVVKPGLTIYFKKPKSWQSAQLYYYQPQPKSVSAVTWTNAPEMVPVQDGWYFYTIESAKSAYVMFKNERNQQIPGPKQAGFLRKSTGWFDGKKWHATRPKGTK
jgi:hypothetical protein